MRLDLSRLFLKFSKPFFRALGASLPWVNYSIAHGVLFVKPNFGIEKDLFLCKITIDKNAGGVV